MSEFRSKIKMALQVIVDSPLEANLEQLLSIARKDLPFAFDLIDASGIQLYQAVDANAELARVLLTIEWEHLGCGQFIDRHQLKLYNTKSAETTFLVSRLKACPEEIQEVDLWRLRNKYATNATLASLVAEQMATIVNRFAERLTAESLEISGDMNSLRKSIRDYGFSSDLDEVLTEIDRELAIRGSEFDQVGTMQHIRSFFEKLHEHISEELRRQKPSTVDGTPLTKCGQAIEFLCRKGVMTEKLQALAKSLYGILSDGGYGCHALKATRDYTRLCRNMVVEYAVTLFFELERRLAEPGN